jgi:hypothetical protein
VKSGFCRRLFFSEEKNQKTFKSAPAHRSGTWPGRWERLGNKEIFILVWQCFVFGGKEVLA